MATHVTHTLYSAHACYEVCALLTLSFDSIRLPYLLSCVFVVFLPSNPAEADKSEAGLAVPCGLAGPEGLPLPSGPHGRTGGTCGDVGALKRISASTFSAL